MVPARALTASHESANPTTKTDITRNFIFPPTQQSNDFRSIRSRIFRSRLWDWKGYDRGNSHIRPSGALQFTGQTFASPDLCGKPFISACQNRDSHFAARSFQIIHPSAVL